MASRISGWLCVCGGLGPQKQNKNTGVHPFRLKRGGTYYWWGIAIILLIPVATFSCIFKGLQILLFVTPDLRVAGLMKHKPIIIRIIGLIQKPCSCRAHHPREHGQVCTNGRLCWLPVHYTTSTNGLQVGYPGQVGGHRGSKQCDRNHHSYPCHPVNGGYRIQKLRCLLILLFLYSYY